MNRTARYCIRRLAQAVPTVFLVVLGNFLLLRLAPGDLVDVIAGESGAATAEYLEQLRQQFGLDKSLLEQFLAYIKNIAQLNLGYSFRYNTPVAELILDRMPATLLLATAGITLAVIVGVTLGALSARFRGSLLDEAISILATMGFAVPVFWFGLMAVVLFSVKLNWLPIGGMTTIGLFGASWWTHVLDVATHLILPALTLSIFYVALYSRITRSAMLEVYQFDYVRTARAKGISEARVVLHHVLRNALLPIVTLTGLQLGAILGGSIVIETVFSWPGLGRLAFDAVASRDLNLLLGLFLINSLLVITMNLLIDILYAALDPRIEVT